MSFRFVPSAILTLAITLLFPLQGRAAPGDANCDGRVSAEDLAAVTSAIFTRTGCPGADANCDGAVSVADVTKTIVCVSDPASCSMCGGFHPCKPDNPSPADGATGVDIPNVLLSWECAPEDDSLTYHVSWGTTPELDSGGAYFPYKNWTLTDLEPDTQYYWQVTARAEDSGETSGPVWTFRTRGWPEGQIVNTTVVCYEGVAFDITYASARSKAWIAYLGDPGSVDSMSLYPWAIRAGQVFHFGPWVLGDPPLFVWRVTVGGCYTEGEYSLASKVGYSTATLLIQHGNGGSNMVYASAFMIQAFIDGEKVVEHPYQNDPHHWFQEIAIPLPFDSVKTGSAIPVELRTDRLRKENPAPDPGPASFQVSIGFERVSGTARIVLE